MSQPQFTLSSYEPVMVLSEEIHIPEALIREAAIQRLAKNHAKEGEKVRLEDAWIASHVEDEDINDVETLLTITRFDLYNNIGPQQDMQDEDRICEELAKRLVEEPPEEMINNAINGSAARFMEGLRQQGKSFETYCEENNVSQDQVKADLIRQAVTSVRQDAALTAYADHENIQIGPDDIYDVIPGKTIEEKMQIRKNTEASGHIAEMEAFVRQVKAMHEVVKNAKIKRTEYGEWFSPNVPEDRIATMARTPASQQ